MLSGALTLLPPSPRTAGAESAYQMAAKSFTSAKWGVALEYPDGWSVEDEGDEVRFRSDQGDTITLGRPTRDTPSEPARGRAAVKPTCSTATTAHSVSATVCIDAASSTRRAVLTIERRDGRRSRLALATRARGHQAFDAMVASARPYP
jgi:hypothetical protein